MGSGLTRPREAQVTLVFSGSQRTQRSCAEALGKAGFVLLVVPPALASWGLPSYTDPLTAEKAGHPNSGHTPGTLHPAVLRHLGDDGLEDREHVCRHVGEAYEDDPRIAFVSVTRSSVLDPEAIGALVTGAQSIAAEHRWQLRLHFNDDPSVAVHDPEDLTLEERVARIERDLAIVKGAAGGR